MIILRPALSLTPHPPPFTFFSFKTPYTDFCNFFADFWEVKRAPSKKSSWMGSSLDENWQKIYFPKLKIS